MKVPFVSIGRQYDFLRDEFIRTFDEVGSSGQYIMGSGLSEFETKIASYCETKYALGLANGSDALFLALKAMGIGEGDEVITCPNSFIASAWVIEATQARTVFVDCAEDYNIDFSKIEEAINPNTKAIIPVHLTGRPSPMDEIKEIALKYNLHILEDSAQAIGAKYKGNKVGSLGDGAAFSLHPLKNLGVMGDGGVFTTNNEELYQTVKKLRNHGLKNRDECEIWGFNSRLDSLQAELASIKLNHLDTWNLRFREIAEFYRSNLKDLVITPVDKPHEESVYHNFVIRVDNRDKLMDSLLSAGIETKIHYPIPIHLQECSKNLGYNKGDFPLTELFASQMISLPIYPELTDGEVEYVVATTRSYF
ncbi:DegT/DnrJ/EryC1/StrS family aminotransferase [Gammaproteobacteria bacterium]|nr:DegT/DnrJ/EryC1/StrS family aminotransferase [Gammaproteobacteria bacterium]